MDAKKTNLTPELKEIYDRVMNTSAGKQNAGPTPNGTLPTTPPTVPNPLDVPTAAVPAPPTAAQTPPTPLQPMPSVTPMPTLNIPSAAEEALTNTPARPISEGNTFAFNGTAKQTGQQPTTAQKDDKTKKKLKISMPIIIVLGVVFMVVWGVFWAIIFGFIKS